MQQIEFTIPTQSEVIVEPRASLPEGYDLTASDVAKIYGVKPQVITWRARHNRLAELEPIQHNGTWWFRSAVVRQHPELEPMPAQSYRIASGPQTIDHVLTRRSPTLRRTGERATYRDREGFLAHLRSLAQKFGPKYLSTYNVQQKMGREGQALYSAALYYCESWGQAVNEALAPLGLSYDADVKASKPWQHRSTKRTTTTK